MTLGGEGFGGGGEFGGGGGGGFVGEPAAMKGKDADVEVAEGEDEQEGEGAAGGLKPDREEGAGGEVEAEGDLDEGEEGGFFLFLFVDGAGLFLPVVLTKSCASAVFRRADELGVFAAEETFEDGGAVHDGD